MDVSALPLWPGHQHTMLAVVGAWRGAGWPQCLHLRSCQIVSQQLLGFCNQELAWAAAAAHPYTVTQRFGFSEGVVLGAGIPLQYQLAAGLHSSSQHLDKSEQYKQRGKHPFVCMSSKVSGRIVCSPCHPPPRRLLNAEKSEIVL